MKLKFYWIALVAIISVFTSCKSDDDFSYQNEFEASRQTWLEFKEDSDNSYQYVVSGGSVFLTYGWETTITVTQGVVTERSLAYVGNLDELPAELQEWTETGDEIGSHQYSGAEALTLDEIYEKAENEWLIDRGDASMYFEANNDGMISTCGYVENGCMDDCFWGIHIKSISGLVMAD